MMPISRPTTYELPEEFINNTLFNLDLIYQGENGYNYSLPRADLTNYLEGNAFGRTEKYTPDEMVKLKEDIANIYAKILWSEPHRTSCLMLSAGAPGAGKTTLMESLLKTEDERGRKFAYIDPDAVCLKEFALTFQADVKASDGSPESRLAAYKKWRAASNGAFHLILAHLIHNKISVFVGSTSSSPFTYKGLELYEKQGYYISLIHVTAPDEVRVESIQKRDQTFIQTDAADIVNKGKDVPQRLEDTYLKYAHHIDFYYRDRADEAAVLAAEYTFKSQDITEIEQQFAAMGISGTTLLHMKRHDREAFQKIAMIHDQVMNAETYPEKGFEALINNHAIKLLPEYEEF